MPKTVFAVAGHLIAAREHLSEASLELDEVELALDHARVAGLADWKKLNHETEQVREALERLRISLESAQPVLPAERIP